MLSWFNLPLLILKKLALLSQGYAISMTMTAKYKQKNKLPKLQKLVKHFNRNKILPELSDPPSGLPLEYMVASFPSKINLNHPLLPLDNSKAAASLHIYKQSLPLMIDQSLQWYGLPCCNSLASSWGSSS